MGKSQAKVLMFDDCVLKIEKTSAKNDESVAMMHWLEGKVPVPKVLAYEKDAENQYLLMSRVTGKMSCDDYYMSRPKELCEHLAQALKLLWSVDISDCPRRITLDDELAEARYRVENNLVDVDDAEPDTYGPDGFENPMALLKWLENNKWLDIALCYRSLKHNADGTWGKKIYVGFNPELFFEALGIEPDWDKIRYYILLDELF